YWDNRFTSNSHPFEWLEAPNALDPYLVAALNEASEPQPQVLHIGCDTYRGGGLTMSVQLS
ncbi:hypothetical protein BS50DRAFT_509142, partial [Corynespora cassiicola Philippines]